MASFDGGIVQEPTADGDGTVPEVLVERFVGVWPGETCERAMDEASLTNTYWKILRLGETEVAAGEGQREPNLILREGEPRFTATVGCNQLGRAATRSTADRLSFGAGGVDADGLPGAARRLGGAAAAGARADGAAGGIDGQTLELLDAAGAPLALFQAVYLY